MKNLEELEALHIARQDMDEVFKYIPGDFFITGSRVVNSLHFFLHKQPILGFYEKVDFDICAVNSDHESRIVDFLEKESHQFNNKGHSYYFDVGDKIFNLIKLNGDSPQDILSRFDMVHCIVAVGKNNCLVMEDAFHHIKHKTINFNYLSSMWKTVGRIVKYCNRGFHVPAYAIKNFQHLCLEFSKKFKEYSWIKESDLDYNLDRKKGISLQHREIFKIDYDNKILNIIRKEGKEKICFIEI